jgi:hypothetical protein
MTGCTVRFTDFTVGSTKNIGKLAQKGEKVVGEDCSSSFLFIPLSPTMVPNFKTAIDRALEKTKGDVIVDAVMWQTNIPAIIYNEQCFKVEGNSARAELAKKH